MLLLFPLLGVTAQTNPSITIVNDTGYTVYYVYISQTASDSWGQDRLDSSQILEDGESVTLSLPYPINVVNRYDIRLVDSDDDSYTKMDVLVSAGSRIVFTFDDFDYEDAVTYDGPPITIVNDTGYTIYYIYISQTASDTWGQDRLGSEVLWNGDSVSLDLPYPINVVNRYDIMVKDIDDDTYTKNNVLVTANARIVFTLADID